MKYILSVFILFFSCKSAYQTHYIYSVQDYKLVGKHWEKKGEQYPLPDTVHLIHSINANGSVQDYVLIDEHWMKHGESYKRPDTLTTIQEYFWKHDARK